MGEMGEGEEENIESPGRKSETGSKSGLGVGKKSQSGKSEPGDASSKQKKKTD